MTPARRTRERGTVVLVALCFVAVLGIALTTYMVVCTRAMTFSSRAGLKSVSEQLAELGLEEAMRALNNSDFNNWTSGSSPNQIACNWSTSGSIANGTLTFPDSQYGSQGISGTVYLRVYNYNTTGNRLPWDGSTAYASGDRVSYLGRTYRAAADNTNALPTDTSKWNDITPYAYAEGVAVLPDSANTTVHTQLRADLGLTPAFPNAIAGTSTSSSNFSANFASNGTIDSYDSSSGTYSSGTATYQAVVAGPYVNFQSSSTLKGFVASTSGSYSTNSVVKSAISAVSPKVDTLRVTSAYNIPAPAVIMPSTSALPSTAAYNSDPSSYPNTLRTGASSIGSVGANTTVAIKNTYDGSSLRAGLYLNDSADVLKIYGHVVLDVTGTLYTYSGRIHIQPNSSLTIRFSGQLFVGSFSSNSGILNESNGIGVAGDPKKCLLYGTDSSSGPHYYWSSTPFYGNIYMPYTIVTVWSGVNFYGAVSAKTVYFPYAVNFHYDTSLRTAAWRIFRPGFYVTTWRELTDPADAQRITLP